MTSAIKRIFFVENDEGAEIVQGWLKNQDTYLNQIGELLWVSEQHIHCLE